MVGGDASTEQMIASTKRGLLVTCLWYIREVDPQTLLLTGLTRDGVYIANHGAMITTESADPDDRVRGCEVVRRG